MYFSRETPRVISRSSFIFLLLSRVVFIPAILLSLSPLFRAFLEDGLVQVADTYLRDCTWRGGEKKRETLSPKATLDLTPEKNRARATLVPTESISGVNRFPCEI